MPVAVVTNAVSDKKPLKSLPDAYVVVRRMTYGEKLARSGMATQFLVGGNATEKDFQGEMKMHTEQLALWDFANLVVDHNLEDNQGNKLNFKNAADVRRLDGTIGEEVGRIIDEFNDAENTEEVKN